MNILMLRGRFGHFTKVRCQNCRGCKGPGAESEYGSICPFNSQRLGGCKKLCEVLDKALYKGTLSIDYTHASWDGTEKGHEVKYVT